MFVGLSVGIRANPLPRFLRRLLGRNGEVDRDAGLGFDGLTRLQVGPKTPLLDCLPGCGRKNRRSAEHVKVLNIPIPSDQSFEHDCALYLHLLGKQGIVRLHWAGQEIGGARRKMDARGGIGYARGISGPRRSGRRAR